MGINDRIECDLNNMKYNGIDFFLDNGKSYIEFVVLDF